MLSVTLPPQLPALLHRTGPLPLLLLFLAETTLSQTPTYPPEPLGLEIQKLGYTVQYDPAHQIANWVAYELTKDEASAIKPDTASGWVNDRDISWAPVPSKYLGAQSSIGIERGHLIPARDAYTSKKTLKETYHMGNCAAQYDSLNKRTWYQLERDVRKWALEYDTLHIVTGPIHQYSGYWNSDIPIPSGYWKAVLRVRPDTAAIAFIIPNERRHLGSYQNYQLSIDSLEAQIEVDLFHSLEDNIEILIESEIGRGFE